MHFPQTGTSKLAVAGSSLSPVGRFLKDCLQNDLQQNDFKKSIKLLAESFVAKSFLKNLASFASPACGKRNLMFVILIIAPEERQSIAPGVNPWG